MRKNKVSGLGSGRSGAGGLPDLGSIGSSTREKWRKTTRNIKVRWRRLNVNSKQCTAEQTDRTLDKFHVYMRYTRTIGS